MSSDKDQTPPWLKSGQPPAPAPTTPVAEEAAPAPTTPVAEEAAPAAKVEKTQTGAITAPASVEKARIEAIDQNGGHETVTVTVPKKFQLRLTSHEVHTFHPGVQEMPIGIAEHWYSKANGVKIYEK